MGLGGRAGVLQGALLTSGGRSADDPLAVSDDGTNAPTDDDAFDDSYSTGACAVCFQPLCFKLCLCLWQQVCSTDALGFP